MDDLDMSGVDPLRWAETRRRVGVVTNYLKLASPSDAERKVHAASLGLSSNQFMALVRAWKAHARASSLAGSGSDRGKRRITGPRHLKDEVRRTAASTVANLPPGASLATATAAVATACAAIDEAAPCTTTVWKMLMEKRRVGGSPGEDGVLVVGRCWVRLPMSSPNGLVMPSLTLAVHSGDGGIIGATMAADAGQEAAVVATAVGFSGLRQLHVEDGMVSVLPPAAVGLGRPTPPPTVRRHLARILGDGIADVRLVYKQGAHERPERLLRAAKDETLSFADAAAVVRAAIDKSNATRGRAAGCSWID